MIVKQMLLVAQGTMQEVLEKSYENVLLTDPNNSSATEGCTPGTTPRCLPNTPADRANYNDVDDYNGFSRTGIMLLDGVTPVAGLANYTVTIGVDRSAAATLGTLSGGAANQVKKITVTVSNGTRAITLVGYRTNYGY